MQTVSWDAIATFVMAAVTVGGINVATIKWMLDRNQKATLRETAKWEEIERGLFELRAALPLEYVRREDWIRFSGTLDAKLDAMREEVRDEIAEIKDRLYDGNV
jgi:hypothetical protein